LSHQNYCNEELIVVGVINYKIVHETITNSVLFHEYFEIAPRSIQ